MRWSIEERLTNLERSIAPEGAFCIVSLDNGEEIEVPVSVYLANDEEMKFVKITKCTMANLEEVFAIIDGAIEKAYE